jgi:hypothetical protein
MDWWVLELLVDLLLVAIVVVLGPLIKRFGKGYAAEVFRAGPRTGKAYLLLMDIAYYLIFGALILFTVSFQPQEGWTATVGAAQLEDEVVRIGALLLVMGLLHGINVLSLPVVGRLLAMNRRLDEDLDRPGAA